MSKKFLIGHHLMRVRIKKSIFAKLQDVAEEEADRTGEHVTVSDLVRAAVYNHLLLHESVRQLEHAPPEELDDEVLFVTHPMLG